MWSRFSRFLQQKKGKKWFHLIKSGAILKAVLLFLRRCDPNVWFHLIKSGAVLKTVLLFLRRCGPNVMFAGNMLFYTKLFWLHCVEPFLQVSPKKKGKKWFHLFKSGAVLKRVLLFLRRYYFVSYLAPFHENGTTVSKRYTILAPVWYCFQPVFCVEMVSLF